MSNGNRLDHVALASDGAETPRTELLVLSMGAVVIYPRQLTDMPFLASMIEELVGEPLEELSANLTEPVSGDLLLARLSVRSLGLSMGILSTLMAAPGKLPTLPVPMIASRFTWLDWCTLLEWCTRTMEELRLRAGA